VVVLWLAVLNAVFGAFLVPLRVGTTVLPVALLFASIGNYALGSAGGRVLGRRLGAAGPALVWLVLSLTFGSRRREGDLIIPSGWVGVSFLVVGAVASAVAYGLAVPAATPGPLSGR
jgi:hypothetical protein